MLSGVWGKKIGMTQVFSEKNTVVPVTAIDLAHWYILGIKTTQKDGYEALCIGCLRKRYQEKSFEKEWLASPNKYFQVIHEVKIKEQPETAYEVGQQLDQATFGLAGERINIVGITKGHGFQGVVKRHNFSGGKASHGPRFGRWPGSLGFMRSQGKIIKGKRLPGHMGVVQRTVKGSEIVMLKNEEKIVLIKGSVPGSAGSFVFLQNVGK